MLSRISINISPSAAGRELAARAENFVARLRRAWRDEHVDYLRARSTASNLPKQQ